MATRFYFGSVDSTNAVSPAFDASWGQTGQATRRKLYRSSALVTTEILADKTVTVPITTTQSILNVQFVSDPIPSQDLIGIAGSVVRGLASATTENANLAIVANVYSNDGGTLRGALFNFLGGSAYTASALTRIMGNTTTTQGVSALITRPGDRLVVEVGIFASAPTTSGSATQRFGTSAATDFAQTAGLSTDLNPWIEFSTSVFGQYPNNYQFVTVGDGMSTTEKIR